MSEEENKSIEERKQKLKIVFKIGNWFLLGIFVGIGFFILKAAIFN